MKLLSYIFILKLIANSNIFNYIKKKHYGQNTLEKIRRLEWLKLKYFLYFLLYTSTPVQNDILNTIDGQIR